MSAYHWKVFAPTDDIWLFYYIKLHSWISYWFICSRILFFVSPQGIICIHKRIGFTWKQALLLSGHLPCTIAPFFFPRSPGFLIQICQLFQHPYFGIQVSYDNCKFLWLALNIVQCALKVFNFLLSALCCQYIYNNNNYIKSHLFQFNCKNLPGILHYPQNILMSCSSINSTPIHYSFAFIYDPASPTEEISIICPFSFV